MAARTAEILERVTKIEALIGLVEDGAQMPPVLRQINELQAQVHALQAKVVVHENTIEELRGLNATLKADMDGVATEFGCNLELVRADVLKLSDRHKVVEADVGLLRQVVGTQDSTERGRKNHKIPEPQPFNGARSAKDLENFLWDLEEYFSAAKVLDDEKVSMAARYLVSDAKLWWRTRVSEDAIAGRSRIETWKSFKDELKAQFLPGNTSWQAREAMKSLKQTASVKEYVKEFCALLLNVRNMSEDDKLFNFESGLKTWAQQELRRQNVQDLQSAIKAAEALVDYRVDKTIPESAPSKSKKGKGARDDEQPHEKRADDGNKWKGKQPESSSKPDVRHKGCFLCDGPHRARDCPKREKLNALLIEENRNKEGQDHGDGSELQLLNTIVSMNNVEMLATLTDDVDDARQKLMQVAMKVNGKDVVAMVDTGATHTVVSSSIVQRLGLKTSKCSSLLKMPNARAQSVDGMVYNVPIVVGSLTGKINVLVIPLDDFDMILGVDFLTKTKSVPMPYLNGMLVSHASSPCFVPCVCGKSAPTRKVETVSAMTVGKGKNAASPVAYLAGMSTGKAERKTVESGQVSVAGSSSQSSWQPKQSRGKNWTGTYAEHDSTRTSNSGGLGGLLDP